MMRQLQLGTILLATAKSASVANAALIFYAGCEPLGTHDHLGFLFYSLTSLRSRFDAEGGRLRENLSSLLLSKLR